MNKSLAVLEGGSKTQCLTVGLSKELIKVNSFQEAIQEFIFQKSPPLNLSASPLSPVVLPLSPLPTPISLPLYYPLLNSE